MGPPGRPTSANRCFQQVPVLLAGRTETVVCQKAQGHKGDHRGPLAWPVRAATPPPGRRG
jgi:hypothetical protein